MLLDNIAIVGGGTSGLVTALILRKTYPKLKIDLIESDKIGIVGVGEGSTEHWSNFTGFCDISTSQLIKETDATFKYGINFDNWNGDGKHYIQSVSSAFNVESQTNSKFVYSWIIANGGTPQDIVHEYVEQSLHRKPYWSINQFHFNTFKLNDFLHKLCVKRKINIVKAEIDSVTLKPNGDIDSLIDSNGQKLSYDFYIDSTGFNRLLLQKTLGVKWKSYNEYLPMNSAIAFPTERTETIPSWTLSRAMNAGWLWRIPTQERYGNGYVFDDRYIDFAGAKQEVEQLYGHKIDVAKEIKFDAGMLEQSWKRNCVAIGLSSSFVEPLEASAIGASIQQAFLFATAVASYIPNSDNTYAERVFNKENQELIENVVDFVALHYVVKRKDTPFWQSVQHLPKTDSLKEKLEIFQHKFPSKSDFENRRLMFKEANWILVMHGLGLISQDVAQRDIAIQPDHVVDSISNNITNITGQLIMDGDEAVDHRTALQWLIDNPEQGFYESDF